MARRPATFSPALGTVEIEAGWKVLDVAPAWAKDKAAKALAAKDGERCGRRRRGRARTKPISRLRCRFCGRARRSRWRTPQRRAQGDPAAQALYRRHLLDRDGNRRPHARRPRAGRRDERKRARHPATRAETIETLLRRAYVERERKNLRATEKGIGLIERIHPLVKSPALTGQWEARLRKIEKGDDQLPDFLADIEKFVIEVIGGMPPLRGEPRRAAAGEPAGGLEPEERSSPALSPESGDPPQLLPAAAPADAARPARLAAPGVVRPAPPSVLTRRPPAGRSSKARTCCW